MAAPAPPAPAAVDALHAPDPQTWDHVVRAVAHSEQLEAAAVLMRLAREHAHDPELLARTRGVRGTGGVTLLMCAVERCDVARAAEIVGACPTPASRAELLVYVDCNGRNALHLACDRDREDENAAVALAEVLLGAGADPLVRAHAAENSWQPIHLAAMWSARLVQRLVAAGASVNGDVAGNSTLRSAAAACDARSVRMIPALVALGARETGVKQAMCTFARWPLEDGSSSDEEVRAALTALVSAGCSLTKKDADGWTPMDTAAHFGNAPVVAALRALGVGATTQSLAHGAAHPDIVRVLLAAGAPPGGLVRLAPGADTVTPLMAAAEASAVESVRLLLGAGASVDRCNERGHTAILYALHSMATDAATVPSVVQTLVAAGTSVAIRDRYTGNTPLHWLALHHAPQPWAAAVARLLLANGASGRQKNIWDDTPAGFVPAGARDGELYALLRAAK